MLRHFFFLQWIIKKSWLSFIITYSFKWSWLSSIVFWGKNEKEKKKTDYRKNNKFDFFFSFSRENSPNLSSLKYNNINRISIKIELELFRKFSRSFFFSVIQHSNQNQMLHPLSHSIHFNSITFNSIKRYCFYFWLRWIKSFKKKITYGTNTGHLNCCTINVFNCLTVRYIYIIKENHVKNFIN